MRLKCACFISVLLAICWWGAAGAGILKSLNQELTALVAKTDPYLVTVKGEDKWHNLIATGIVCDPLGHLITSSKAYEADKFQVIFKDGRTFSATKVGVDKQSGLAILKIIGSRFVAPDWGRADKLNQGAWIIVAGNSYGIPATVNFGYFNGLTEDGLLGLSVDASPGSSGGAVLNIDGQVIGVLIARDAKAPEGEDSAAMARVSSAPYSMRLLRSLDKPSGQCYAVPMDVAMSIAGQIIRSGRMHRGYLGVTGQDLEPAAAAKIGLHGGVIITGIDKSSPAATAGIRIGDIIVNVDSTERACRASLFSRVKCHGPGDTLALGILRNKEKLSVNVILTEAKDEPVINGLELSEVHSNRKSANNQAATDTTGVGLELSRLKTEFTKLQARMNLLEQKIKK